MKAVNDYMMLGTPLQDIKAAAYNYLAGKMGASVLVECVIKYLRL